MQAIVYVLYGLVLTAFLVFAIFAANHALRYSYIAPRVKTITTIFIIVSAVLVTTSIYLLIKLGNT